MRNVLRRAAIGVLSLVLLAATSVPGPVADAAMRGDMEALTALIRQGADVNAAQGDGMTALHWAAANGNTEMAGALVSAGAALNALTRLGSYTPLHLAAREGHSEVVTVLLAAGANARALTSTGGVSALHFAAEAGTVEIITALAENGADVNLAEQRWGETPLMFAAARNRAEAITALVRLGADPKISARVIDMVKRSEEDDAAKKAKAERLGLAPGAYNSQAARVAAPAPAAVSQGAAPAAAPGGAAAAAPAARGPRGMSVSQQIGGYGGLTALTLAVRDGNVAAANALLDAGADINQGTAGDHTAPLLMAALNGQFDLAMSLLQRGADPKAANDAGGTALFATIQTQWQPRARYPMPQNHLRQRTTYLELMEALLKAGADVNSRLKYNVWTIELGSNHLTLDWTGATPFLRATHGTDVEAMKLLLKYGADPNVPTLTPGGCIGTYACQGPIGVVGGRGQNTNRQQVEAPGAAAENDPSGLPAAEPGGPGIYPIHAASGYAFGYDLVGNVHRHVDNGWLPAVKVLVEELGADVNARDFRGDTPLHNAAARGDNEMVLYLVSKGADVMALNRRGQTTADMANGPTQRVEAFPETVKLLESLGSRNNHKCVSC